MGFSKDRLTAIQTSARSAQFFRTSSFGLFVTSKVVGEALDGWKDGRMVGWSLMGSGRVQGRCRVGGWSKKKKSYLFKNFSVGKGSTCSKVAKCPFGVRLVVSLGCPVTHQPISITKPLEDSSATASYRACWHDSNGIWLLAVGRGWVVWEAGVGRVMALRGVT